MRASRINGTTNPATSGAAHAPKAAAAPAPRSTRGLRRALRCGSSKRARRRAKRSSAISTPTKASRIIDSFAAEAGSPIDSQARNIPVVNVCTPKYDTVPKSESVSISASAAPAAIAGRAIGRLSLKKVARAESPSVRPASARLGDCSMKATRVSR